MQDHGDFFSAVTALGAIQELNVDAMRLLYRIECSGEDFYNLIADRIGNDRAADLLRKNAREERGHAERVRKAIAIKLGKDKYEPTTEDCAKYAIPLPESIPAEMFALIVQGCSSAVTPSPAPTAAMPMAKPACDAVAGYGAFPSLDARPTVE
jgi:hypothetical protein